VIQVRLATLSDTRTEPTSGISNRPSDTRTSRQRRFTRTWRSARCNRCTRATHPTAFIEKENAPQPQRTTDPAITDLLTALDHDAAEDREE
jgi:hypothetical protein